MRRGRVVLALVGSLASAAPVAASDKLPPKAAKAPSSSPAANSDDPMPIPDEPGDSIAAPSGKPALPSLPPAPSADVSGDKPVNLDAYPFVLFFEWDSSSLSAGAAEVLDSVADKYHRSGGRVTISGFADKSGGGGYNRDLSQRRVAVVKAYLASKDIEPDAISTEAYGEDRPLVDTADGLREPQNRRVEITVIPATGSASLR